MIADGRPADDTRIAEVMSDQVISCDPSEDQTIAEELMIRHQKARIVCTDRRGRLQGVISLSDIAKADTRGRAGAIAASIASREAIRKMDQGTDGGARKCSGIMTSDVECCSRDEPISQIAALMRDRNIGFVPVCDDEGALVGTITDRDLAMRVVAAERPPAVTRVQDVFTPELLCCSPDDPLRTAEDVMSEYKKSRIICADAGLHPLGVISLSDIARVEQPERVSRVLRAISS